MTDPRTSGMSPHFVARERPIPEAPPVITARLRGVKTARGEEEEEDILRVVEKWLEVSCEFGDWVKVEG